MSSYLAYGAIGLGLALSVLAFRLLSREQDQPGNARKPILNATYVYMGFALALAAGGFVSEYMKSNELTSLREHLIETRSGIKSLMDQKEGKVARLRQLDPSRPEYVALVREIQADLESLDEGLRDALG